MFCGETDDYGECLSQIQIHLNKTRKEKFAFTLDNLRQN